MSEQGKFLEELEAVKSIAASQDNKLTKDEVKKYLSDLELSDDKMEQVYYYLSLAGIEVEGYRFVPKQLICKVMIVIKMKIKSFWMRKPNLKSIMKKRKQYFSKGVVKKKSRI